MPNDPKLRRWYLIYRQKYFPELPEDTQVYYHTAESPDWGSVTEFGGKFTIFIDPVCMHVVPFVRQVLLHEMAHVKLWPDTSHGKRFKNEKARLFAAGAYDNLL